MRRNRDNRSTIQHHLARRLLQTLMLAIAIFCVAVGCSSEARYRFKTIVFTGVPPPHDEQAADGAEQGQAPRSAAEEQMARQQEYREALISRYWQHGPFAAGECGRCHSLSQSQSFLGNRDATSQAPSTVPSVSATSRLTMPKQQLCISCHSQHGAEFARTRGLHQHPPAATGDCTGCHSPHQSLRQYMLLRTNNYELCGGCHGPETLTPVHVENSQQDCINCHNAHVGTTSKLLRADTQELKLLYGGGNE